ncbi:alpha/beta hydrolase [Brevundimonas sp. GN22]
MAKTRLSIIVVLSAVVMAFGASAQPSGSGATVRGAPVTQAPFESERIIVEVRGRPDGPDVVLIPGLASTSAVWAKLVPELEGQYRLHLVTVRGFGEYPAQGNASGYLGTAVAAEISRYIETEGLQRPAVIGHSMGGQLALRIAADGGDSIGRVMLVDSSPFFPSLINRGATRADVEPLARLAYQGVMLLGDDMLRSHPARLGLDLGDGADRVFNGLGWQGGDRRVLAQGVFEVLTTDLRYRLPDITAPVTIVYGWSADASSPRAVVDDLFRYSFMNLRQPARFERVQGAEHMVMIDQPRTFGRLVQEFLR